MAQTLEKNGLCREVAVTETELVRELAQRVKVSEQNARSMLDALADIIHEAIRNDQTLPLASFGAFCSETCRQWTSSPLRPPPPDHAPSPNDLNCSRAPFRPTSQQVEDIIKIAESHPLGLEFLLEGELSAVAAAFQSHAFTVEAARDCLARRLSLEALEPREKD